jgi:hypothetical protein
MSNVRQEAAPALAAFGDRPGPVVIRRAGLTAQTALEALGPLEPGGRLFALSKGAVSAGDVLAWALAQTGPVDALVSTWTISPDEIKALRRTLDAGGIRRLRLLVDFSFRHRHPAYCAELRATFGPESVSLTVCHAKVSTLVNATWGVVIRSSANLNRNSRTEYHEVSDDPALAAFVADTLGQWFPPAPDLWSLSTAGHKARFAAWGEAPGAQVSSNGNLPARVAGKDGKRALEPANETDRAFFSDEPYGVDLRRAGLTYSR